QYAVETYPRIAFAKPIARQSDVRKIKARQKPRDEKGGVSRHVTSCKVHESCARGARRRLARTDRGRAGASAGGAGSGDRETGHRVVPDRTGSIAVRHSRP